MKHLMFLSAGVILLLVPRPAWAHALGAQWQINGDKVLVEAYFSDGTLAQGAIVRLFKDGKPPASSNEPEKPLFEVKTDAKGECTFARPEPGKYRIVVDAGAGHRKELPPWSSWRQPKLSRPPTRRGRAGKSSPAIPGGSVVIVVGCLAVTAWFFGY